MTTMTVEERSVREKIFDVREQRRLASPLEMRTDALSGHVVLEGYASTFEPYDVFGGPSGGGWVEQLDKRAFDKTLGANPDVQLLVNHEGWPLARTKSGTLELSVDDHGLKVRAMLDTSDPDVQRLLPKMKRGDMDEMSFAFRVSGQDWSTDYMHRNITEVNLQKGDVSVVNYGANPTTHAALSDAIGALAQLSNSGERERAEVRKLAAQIEPAQVDAALHALEQMRSSTPKKYGDVDNFADPGYLDSSGKPAKDGNGVKRYPLNSADRVRNALSRFSQNKDKYSSSQQSAIMGKIEAAAKKFGVKTGGDDSDMKSIHHHEVVRAADGTNVLVAVFTDGTCAPATVPAVGAPATLPEPVAFSTSPTMRAEQPAASEATDVAAAQELLAAKRAEFSSPAAYDPLPGDGDAHNSDALVPGLGHAPDLNVTKQINPADGGTPSVPAAGGYDPHTEAFGPVQTLSKKDDSMARDQDALDTFRDEECGDDDMGMDKDKDKDKRADDDDTDDGSQDDDNEESSRTLDGVLAAALEATIIEGFNLAESGGSIKDVRNILARARRQIRDLQGKELAAGGDLKNKIAELRSEFGDPDTITVSEGLRSLKQAGFADMMHDEVVARRGAAAEPFPNDQ